MHKQPINQRLARHILVMDGAMGTMLQEAGLTAADFGGPDFEGCNEHLNLTAPQAVENVHRAYLAAGADIIETNTFGATCLVLDEYGLGAKAYEINRRGAEIASAAAKAFSTFENPRYVAGSMGPTTKMLSLTGGATFEELVSNFQEQAQGLLDGGVDLLLVETAQDTLNVKAAYLGIQAAEKATGKSVPLMISGTIENNGTTLGGQSIEAFYISVAHMKPLAVGLNCATGPEFMTDHIRTLAAMAECAISCYPNAGLPDENGCYSEAPKQLSQKLAHFAEEGWLNIIGGCCGTTPKHIAAIKAAVKDKTPREIKAQDSHQVSGIEPFTYDDPTLRPIMVGERTNVIGSRKFKNLIREGQFETAAEIAREQVKKGAHVIDICLSDPDSDELANMESFIKVLVNMVKVPLMIDTMDSRVLEIAFKNSQGKSIVNSINLEEGETRFQEVAQLLHQYGGAVVVGTIDENGMAVTAQNKLKITKRSYDLLVNKYGIRPEDIIFDPLVFPVGTGDVNYIGSAKETVEGIRLIKEAFPKVQTILGVSNVSFGLPGVGREVLNAVYLHHCTKAGLDYAIVNTEKLKRFASISPEEIAMAEALLFETTDEILARFTDFYRDKVETVKTDNSNLTLEERLSNCIIEGSKTGLLEDLAAAREIYSNPLDIVNGPLMAGMAKVGQLFNDNELIVAEVLQSAGVMKTAVSYLEQFLEKDQATAAKGKFLIATVKGDVHDIGKNLVEIILSNNGYQVIDLGIKVDSATLIQAIKAHQPDMVGLSGLLVKSAQQMVLTAQDMKAAGINIPILVGGAALSRKFTKKIAAVYDGLVLYAKDAMTGLELANQLMTAEGYQKLLEEAEASKAVLEDAKPAPILETSQIPKASTIARDLPVAVPKNTHRHVYNITNKQLAPFINKQMLFSHHLGLKGKISELLAKKDEKVLKMKALMDEIAHAADEHGWLAPRGVYRFFPAQSDGNTVLVYDPKNPGTVLETFEFPRQTKAPYLCLADYLKPVASGEMDYVGFFVATSGTEYLAQAQALKDAGQFLESHGLFSLALESAEGVAESIHKQMREDLGIPDSEKLTVQDLFATKYQGGRFSFGYPACPDLSMQEKLFRLLEPEDIGIKLTDGYMMEPEASVSAMVVAHPEARYFKV